MPFHRGVDTLGTSIIYDSGKYHDLLDRTLAHAGFADMQAKAAARRAAGEMVGVGLALFVEKSGLGPHDLVRLTLLPDGTVEMVTGVASVGQGVETALAQICAETLTTPIEQIHVIHGQTDRIEVGMGAFASRVTVMAGSATKAAAEALRDRLFARAAPLLQAQPEDLEMRDGEVAVQAGASISLAALAAADPSAIAAEGWFRAAHMNYPYGVHVAQVLVDPATCGIRIERYLVACDVGRIVNPMLVEGQVVGAAAQGIGGALLEEFVYDDSGQPLATSFADYLMPTLAEVPFVETLLREDAPSPQNPLGVKGAGEGGITAAGAALAAAVGAAIGRPGAICELPITPSRLHALLTMPVQPPNQSSHVPENV
jgi:carbon-monoxide dehydrogenase large subunit